MTTIASKLQLRPNQTLLLLNAPAASRITSCIYLTG
jgi:hypothetical protein